MTKLAGDGEDEAVDLVRLEELAVERADTWKHTQQMRRKVASVGVCRNITVKGLTECPDGDEGGGLTYTWSL